MAEFGLPTRTVERALAEVIAFLDPDGAPASGLWLSTDVDDYLRWAHATGSGWGRTRARLFGPPRFAEQDRKAWLGRLVRSGVVGVEGDSAPEDTSDDDTTTDTADTAAESTETPPPIPTPADWDATFTMAADTRTALLDAMPPERYHRAARTAASVLERAWGEARTPDGREAPGPVDEATERLLFANFHTLRDTAGEHLVRPEAHALLFWVGQVLREDDRPADLLAHLTAVRDDCDRLLGSEHPSTLRAVRELADARQGHGGQR